jgi:hypothetical protein
VDGLKHHSTELDANCKAILHDKILLAIYQFTAAINISKAIVVSNIKIAHCITTTKNLK